MSVDETNLNHWAEVWNDGSPPEWYRQMLAERVAALQVGDRVRIRLSGECRLTPDPGTVHAQSEVSGHDPREDGRTGFVKEIDVNNSLGVQGHPYGVFWDTLMECGPYFVRGDWYAAVELEKIGE